MSVFPSWPWTNFHEMNLDWVIKTVKECKEIVEEALADVSNAVATYFADHLDATLTRSGKAADAAAVGDAIRGNAADIASLDTTVQGITNNVSNLTTRVTRNEGNINNLLTANDALDTTIQGITNNVSNLTTRVTRNEGTINNLLAADRSLDDRLTELNNSYQGTRTDVINLTSRVSHNETQISGLGDADEALSNRITALEGSTGNAVKDYVFTIYEYDGANDPLYICTMEESPNGINSLLSDLNGRIPVNVKAIINYDGITGSRVANLTTVRVGGEIHGVEFDAGDFHCRFLDSNTMGAAYFNKVYISTNRTAGTCSLVKGDFNSLKLYTPQITITDSGSDAVYIPIFIDRSQAQDYIKLWYLHSVDDIQHMENYFVRVNVDNTVQLN